jgi:hypothetical protein
VAAKAQLEADALMAELLRMTADVMIAKETAARLEGELAAPQARRWWRPLGRMS